MRRMWAAGAAIVMCLALGGLPSVAQSPSPGPGATPTVVTGSSTNCNVTQGYTSTMEGGVEHLRDGIVQCIVSADDPRITGTVVVHPSCDCSSTGCACWGPEEMSGTEGGWTGYYGSSEPNGEQAGGWHVFTGTGANEGWTCVLGAHGSEFAGMIYEGPPPPFGPLPSPASK